MGESSYINPFEVNGACTRTECSCAATFHSRVLCRRKTKRTPLELKVSLCVCILLWVLCTDYTDYFSTYVVPGSYSVLGRRWPGSLRSFGRIWRGQLWGECVYILTVVLKWYYRFFFYCAVLDVKENNYSDKCFFTARLVKAVKKYVKCCVFRHFEGSLISNPCSIFTPIFNSKVSGPQTQPPLRMPTWKSRPWLWATCGIPPLSLMRGHSPNWCPSPRKKGKLRLGLLEELTRKLSSLKGHVLKSHPLMNHVHPDSGDPTRGIQVPWSMSKKWPCRAGGNRMAQEYQTVSQEAASEQKVEV